jgi:NAD/NADP transhydrogenase beta subunit
VTLPAIRDSGSGAGRDAARERALRDLNRLRFITRIFDDYFRVPGTRLRFGVDALIGLVPGLGDIAAALVGVYALRVARNLGVPNVIQMHMLVNIALDALVGSIPLLGDAFDFFFRAQSRNLALIEAWVATPHKAQRRSRLGLLGMALAIVVVFATLTALAVWMIYILVSFLRGLAGS